MTNNEASDTNTKKIFAVITILSEALALIEAFFGYISHLFVNEYCDGQWERNFILIFLVLFPFIFILGFKLIKSKIVFLGGLGGLFLMAISLLLFRFSSPALDTIVIAPFHHNDSYDRNNLINSISKGLKKGLQSEHANFLLLKKQILEINSERTLSRCFENCGGSLIVWGSYSEKMEGSLFLNLKFRNQCFQKWVKDKRGTFNFVLKNITPDTEIVEMFTQIGQDISTFSALGNTRNCEKTVKDEKIANSVYEKIKQRNSQDDWSKSVLTILFRYFHSISDLSKSEEIIDFGLTQFKEDPDLLEAKSYIRYLNNDYDVALQFIDRALVKEPGRASSLNEKGLILSSKGKSEKAIANIHKAIQYEADIFLKGSFIVNAGLVYEDSKKFDNAEASFSAAIDLTDGALDQAYLYRARVRSKKGSFQEAYDDYQTFFQLNGGYGDAMIFFCSNLVALKKYAEAELKCQGVQAGPGMRFIDYINLKKDGKELEVEFNDKEINLYYSE